MPQTLCITDAQDRTINNEENGLKEYSWLSLLSSGEESSSAFQLFRTMKQALSGGSKLAPVGEAYKEF